jgi:hypothetical protein
VILRVGLLPRTGYTDRAEHGFIHYLETAISVIREVKDALKIEEMDKYNSSFYGFLSLGRAPAIYTAPLNFL